MLRVVFLRVVFSMVQALALLVVLMAQPAEAQELSQATDVTSADMQKFIHPLPRVAGSDRPLCVVNVTGQYPSGGRGLCQGGSKKSYSWGAVKG